MIELKINIESIDYRNVIGKILPQVIENMKKRADAEFAVSLLSKLESASPAMVKASLALLPQEMKDELAVACLEHYKQEICNAINKIAKEKDIDIIIGEIQASKQ